MRAPLARPATVVAVALATVCALLLCAPAEARSESAPVTASDTVTTYPRNLVEARVLANDSDADGDTLTVCGLSPAHYPHIRADLEVPRKILLSVGYHARPGTYTYTYQVCDGTSQTPGTLTLVVAAPPRVTVTPVPHRSGMVRATSRAAFPLRLTYGGRYRDEPDGTVRIPRRGSVLFSTRHHDMIWLAYSADSDVFIARGQLSDIP